MNLCSPNTKARLANLETQLNTLTQRLNAIEAYDLNLTVDTGQTEWNHAYGSIGPKVQKVTLVSMIYMILAHLGLQLVHDGGVPATNKLQPK